MFGYGIGTGPPGVGVLQTSGIVAIDTPLLPLWTREFAAPLTLTVTGIDQAPVGTGTCRRAAPRSPVSELAHESAYGPAVYALRAAIVERAIASGADAAEACPQ